MRIYINGPLIGTTDYKEMFAAVEENPEPVEVIEIVEEKPEIVEHSIEDILEAMRVIKESCIAEDEKHDGCKMCPLYDEKRGDCAVMWSAPDKWNLEIKGNKIDLLGERNGEA